jgi:endonuclease I
MSRVIATVFIINIFFLTANAQFHIPVFPELDGEALIEAVEGHYRPPFVLSYSDARDTLYGTIDARNDTLYCVYTGHGIYLPPGEDPSDAAFQNGSGINAEHTYPRSKGTESTRPKADMQHIFPTRVDVNADRGSFPFFDVPDSQTQTWYIQDQQQSSVPSAATIDLYSELGNMAFEPRESHKGDVARAMFYVYTVYRAETDAADPLFFESQRTTLCLWNEADPIDDREFERTFKIAAHQGGIPNPFIIDCTLATRTYCGEVTAPCVPTGLEDKAVLKGLELLAAPNPAGAHTVLTYYLPSSAEGRLELLDLQGRQLQSIPLGYLSSGAHQYELPITPQLAAKRVLICRLVVHNEWGVEEASLKLLTKN